MFIFITSPSFLCGILVILMFQYRAMYVQPLKILLCNFKILIWHNSKPNSNRRVVWQIKSNFLEHQITKNLKICSAPQLFIYINTPCSENDGRKVSASRKHFNSSYWAFLLWGDNSCSKMKERRWRHKISSHRLHFVQTIGYTHVLVSHYVCATNESTFMQFQDPDLAR